MITRSPCGGALILESGSIRPSAGSNRERRISDL